MSGLLTLVSKKTFQKPKCQEPLGSNFDRLMLVLNNICHVRTQNNIKTPSIRNKYEIDLAQKCNIMHQKYVDITEIRRHQNAMQTSSEIAIQLP